MHAMPRHRMHSHPRRHTYRREKRTTMGKMHPKTTTCDVCDNVVWSRRFTITQKHQTGPPKLFIYAFCWYPCPVLPSPAAVCATSVATYIFQGFEGAICLVLHWFCIGCICIGMFVVAFQLVRVCGTLLRSDGFFFAARWRCTC